MPDSIVIAVAAYQIHKMNQFRIDSKVVACAGEWELIYTAIRTELKWDKDKDVQAVFDACRAHGFTNCSSSVGTFWFSKGDKNYEMDETTWPLAEIIK